MVNQKLDAKNCTYEVYYMDNIQFNSVYFVLPNITNYTFASEGFTICTHTTSLSQDLTSDQEIRHGLL